MLSSIHEALCVIGCLLCVAMMQCSCRHGDLINHGRFEASVWRVGFALVGLSMAWSLQDLAVMGRPPFAGHVMLIAVLDLAMVIRIGQITSMQWRARQC